VNGVKTDDLSKLLVALENTKPGDAATVVYYRGNKKITTEIQLSDRAKSGVSN
jgi:S1-C subfamily serine protease